MEITFDNEYKARTIRGFCHLYDGQEAVATGVEAGLTRQDSWITSYRCHCTMLARGGNVQEIAEELFGFDGGALSLPFLLLGVFAPHFPPRRLSTATVVVNVVECIRYLGWGGCCWKGFTCRGAVLHPFSTSFPPFTFSLDRPLFPCFHTHVGRCREG